MIQKVKSKSSNLSSIWYDKDNKLLSIEFKSGGYYNYYNVPEQVFNELRVAKSQGGYFHKNIRDKFKYKKLRKGDI